MDSSKLQIIRYINYLNFKNIYNLYIITLNLDINYLQLKELFLWIEVLLINVLR